MINIHFIANEDGKKSIKQLPDNFTCQDFIKIIIDLFGSHATEHYTFVAKGKALNLADEVQFGVWKKNLTNGVNIFVGRRMHGGEIINV
ncbi:unnamed protein product [Rotaria socialis]|uniref:Uncharacterized protein n=2 Tax=Rotaria socialis TaxID=392032 RepID=A0A817YGR1_9BILA|nr:unnamed protein product [Rotaria socialis]CAF3779750.1 unnamed protein product [Rotaria socialis]